MTALLRAVLLLSVVIIPAIAAPAAGTARTVIGKDALTKLLAYYRSITTLEARFRETKHLKDLKLELQSEGKLTVRRPDKVIWEITKPAAMVVSLDEKQVRIESGTGPSRRVETVSVGAGGEKASASLRNLVAWLKLDPDELSRQYEIFAAGEREYEFVPRDRAATPFESLTMTLKSEGYVERLLIREQAGDSIAIRFEKPRIERAR